MNFDISSIMRQLVVLVPGFLLAVTVHEFMHGYIAYRLGDPTAKRAGRLTLNPISHLDLLGTVALIMTRMIGWAKPVPVDPRYLRNPRSDMMWISLGGPGANLLTAIVLAVGLHIFLAAMYGGELGAQIRMALSRGFVPQGLDPMTLMLFFAIQINVGLGIFNLIPVPPLDGSKIAQGLLPRRLAYSINSLEPFGFVILLGLILVGAVNYLIVPPIRFVLALLITGIG